MRAHVTLVGLDFGSTTSSCVVARAILYEERGRVEIRDARETFRSEMALTPFDGDALDEPEIARMLDDWLTRSGARPEDVIGGGAIVTGLAAQKGNASAIARLVRARLHDAVISAAGDPLLESWLAFMGSASSLSRREPQTPILNLDIGGGTTNLALGKNGEVQRTSALFVGARHVQVETGTYRITRLSSHARGWLSHLKIPKNIGDPLEETEVQSLISHKVRLLEDEVRALAVPEMALCYSGGVGELIHAARRGDSPRGRSEFGDLGGELAQGILASPLLSSNIVSSENTGRATSYGLLRHSTQVSGATLFLPSPSLLPLVDLPILGQLSSSSTEEEVTRALGLVARSESGGCLTITLDPPDAASIRDLGRRVAKGLQGLHQDVPSPLDSTDAHGLSPLERPRPRAPFPMDRPLVLLCQANAAKALGGYATEWGRLSHRLVVIDEVRVDRAAHFVQIGRLRETVVPVSFHGMSPGEPADD